MQPKTIRQGRRDVPTHYLRPNHRTWSPPALISFDTETRWSYSGDNEVHDMRLWSARFSDRRPQRSKIMVEDDACGYQPEDFAVTVHKWTRDRRTVWMTAHNLNFDLCTTDLVAQLEWLGWELTDFAIDGKSPFLRLRQAEHHLTVFDSYSWLPAKLSDIGLAVGVTKPVLPANDDSDDEWFARCKGDVDILHTAMLRIMDWWDDNELGNWNVTGAASGWNAMRHIPTADKVLINADSEQNNADRKAIYGGRRYCYRHSAIPIGRYSDVDITKAYTVACRDLPLPVERIAHYPELPTDTRWLDSERYGLLAYCTIRCATPRYPVRHNGLVWYPTGTFRTYLAGPELREARDRGELVSIKSAWLHKLGNYMRPFATWCIDSQSDADTSTPDVCKMVLRNWGRSNAGKWAQRGFDTIKLGASPFTGLACSDAWDHDAGVPASILDYGGYRWITSASLEAENGYPAVLAWIESYVRVALNRAIDIIGPEHVICCDTDGLIIASEWIHKLALTADACAPFSLREKKVYSKIHVYGPQHLKLDKGQHMAGIPGSAEPTDDGRLWARTWPKLAWQIQNGRQRSYVRPVSYYRLSESYVPGWKLADGTVCAVQMTVNGAGDNHILSWRSTENRPVDATLVERQHTKLEALHDGKETVAART